MSGVAWSTLPQLLSACAEHRGPERLLIDGSSSLTGHELLVAVDQAAQTVRHWGIAPGHRVAFDTRGGGWLATAVGYCGLVAAGIVPVLVHTDDTLEASDSDLGVVGVTGLDLVVKAADRRPMVDSAEVLDIVFTSGTTGRPRAVVSRHQEWLSASRPEMLLSQGRRTVGHCGVPFAVSGGVHGIFINHLLRGVSSVHAATPTLLSAAAGEGAATELHLTPFAARGVARVVSTQERRPAWADRIRVIRLVGASVSDDVRSALKIAFPAARCVSIYALTEGGSACLVDVHAGDTGTLGSPSIGTQFQVRDPEGRRVAPGGTGEILIRAAGAPPIFADSSLESQRHMDGWTRTGDMATVMGDGSVRLVGRAREQVNLGSGRLSPDTVEDIIRRRTQTGLDFAVAAVEVGERSDALALFVAGAEQDPAVVEFLDALARVKRPFRPRFVRVVADLPRNGLGKVLRRELLSGLAAEDGSGWSGPYRP